MTALLGKTLLFAGCTAFGLLWGSRLRQRTACLGEFRRTLAGLARELAFPAPCVGFDGQRGGGDPGANGGLFRTCRRRFAEGGQESWAESWTEALEQVALPLEGGGPSPAPGGRGMCWAATMGRASGRPLEGLLRGLEGQAAEAAETARRLCRVISGAGPAAGLFCLILL